MTPRFPKTPAAKRPRGRPSSFTQETADQIILRLSAGEPMARICASPGMPSYPTVLKWQDDFPDFLDASVRAREAGTHYIADDCLRISDDKKLDPAAKRIMVDTRLRLIGMWNRKAYGDKADLNVNHGGAVKMVVTPDDEKTL